MCLLILECYYVIGLVVEKQISSFLLNYNRPKRSFSPGEVGEYESCMGGVGKFEPELLSLSSNIDIFYF